MKGTAQGASMVEFALVLVTFMMFFFAVVDFSRLIFTWSTAAEASRVGARYAAICDDKNNASGVLQKMQSLLPQIAAIEVRWSPPNCLSTNCVAVTVRITDLKFPWIAPLLGQSAMAPIVLPDFSTTVVRESMKQDAVAAAIACR